MLLMLVVFVDVDVFINVGDDDDVAAVATLFKISVIIAGCYYQRNYAIVLTREREKKKPAPLSKLAAVENG